MADPLGPIDDAAYARLRHLLSERFGLEFSDRRREVVRLHLRDHAQASKCATWGQYISVLEGPQGPQELTRIIDSVTVHQTEFFRHRQLFEALRHRIIPGLSADAHRQHRPVRIWSAGCSTGEEPYSLAMIALESAREGVAVVATDLAPGVLRFAQAGAYSLKAVANIPPDLRTRHLKATGPSVEVGPELRKAVTFAHHNLARDAAPLEGADLVMCCNVTIYFSDEAFQRTVRTLCGAIRPGGYLVLGHSESLWRVDHPLELVDLRGAFAYRRPLPEERPLVAPKPAAGRPMPAPAPLPPNSPTAPAKPARTAKPLTKVVAPSLVPAASALYHTLPPSPRPVELAELVAAAQGMLERDDLATLETILEVNLAALPSTPELHLLLGILRQRQGKADEAAASFSRAIYCDASCSLAWFYRAAVLDVQGAAEKAAGDYSTAARCLARDPAQRWDQFLESMGHQALIRHCQERSAALGSSRERSEVKTR